MSESGQPLDSFEVLLRRRMVSASDRALRAFEPSAVALKAAAGSAARPAAKSAGRTGWYVVLAAMLVLTALLFAAGSGAFRNLSVAPVIASPSPHSSPAPSLAPSPSPHSSPAPSLAPSPSPQSSVAPSLAPSQAADGLILYGIDVPVGDGNGGVTHCTTFHTIHPDGSNDRQLPVVCMPYGNANWRPCKPFGSCGPVGDSIIIDSTPLSSSTTEIDELAIDGDAPDVLLMLSGGFAPTFSPDGSQIAYSGLGSAPGAGGIFIAAADGTQPHQLTSPAGGSTDFQPRYSPDGTRLVFTRVGSGIWMVNTDGTDLHQLTAPLAWSMDARWSPDGSQLLFTGSEAGSIGDEGLWIIDADGTGLNPVGSDTVGQGRDKEADWSPDGTRIVYTHLEPGVNSLRAMNADGSGVTTLLSNNDGNKYMEPDWGQPPTH